MFHLLRRRTGSTPLVLFGLLGSMSATACGDDASGTGGAGGTATSGTQSTSGTASTASSSPAGQGGAGGDTTTTASQSPSSSNTTSAADGGGGSAAEGDAPTETIELAPSTETFPNPERGFYSYVDLLDEGDFDGVHERGHTLVYSYVHLDAYRDDDELPGALLSDLDAALARLREEGLKIVLRFAYNEGPYPDSEPDAPLDRVLAHIDQLTPTLQANADVIAVLQGGFVGAWGEWHTSTNDLTEPAARQAIVEALLTAMPASRSVLMRYPPYKEALFGTPLDPSEAWSGSDESRLGHHNDCFLSSESDVGTYPDDAVETWKQYIEDDTRFVPNGGETCDPFPPRSECASALAEMERLHYTFMNQDYHPDIVESWVEGGCKDEMDQRLGYRLVVESADLPPALRPGGSFALHVRIRNEGYAAPMNPRALRIVLEAGGTSHDVALPGIDARMLMPGETTDVAARIRVPSSLTEGDATLALWLPDPDLEGDARQSIRLANEGTWDDASGANALGAISIADGAPGTSSEVEALEAAPL